MARTHVTLALPVLTLMGLLAAGPGAASQSTALSYKGSSHGAEFGTVVAVIEAGAGGDRALLVGCPEDDTNGEDSGAAFVIDGSDGHLIRAHYGAAAGDRFGAAVAGFDDANGDFTADYAIGAPLADSNGVDAGRLQVFSGADGTVLSTMNGAAAGDRFGSAVASIGRIAVNPFFPEGDPALAIGAPYADGSGTDSGKIYIRYWGGTAPPFPPAEVSGTQANEHYGSTLGGRFDRLVVGAPDYDSLAGSNAGRIQAFQRRYPTLGDTVTLTSIGAVAGASPGDRFGSAVAIIDWVSGSAVYAGGAPDAGTPYVRLYDDSSGTLSLPVTLTGSGRFGSAIASIRRDDNSALVAIGSPEQSTVNGATGQVTIYSVGAVTQVIPGSQPGERFGSALGSDRGLAYESGEGYLGIGAPLATAPMAGAGRAAEYRSAQFSPSASLVLDVPAVASKGDRAGSAVAGLGVVNGDGVPDILVGLPEADSTVSFPVPGERIDCGAARVISGASGAVLRTHLGGDDGDRLGSSVAALGDVNLDGVTDYVIGAPQTGNPTDTQGYALVCSGATGSTLFTLSGAVDDDEFGAAVGGGSDLNGDGRPDILVGAPGTTNGTVYCYSGSTGFLIGGFSGAAAGDRFGAAVAGLGADLDGDGKQEYLVGAPNADVLGNADAGRAYLLKSISSLTQVNAATGFAAFDHCGASVAAAGDLNQDGKTDWLVGIPGYDGPSSNAGRVRVIDSASVTGAQLFSGNGDGANDNFGSSVTALGDVNHDGWPDWADGATEIIFISAGPGYVKVISGKDEALLFKISGASGDALGSAVADAGDLDFDGTRDLLAGGPFNDEQGVNSGIARVYSLANPLAVWSDLGLALAGTFGPPALSGTGSLLAGKPGALTLSNARPSAPAYLFIGPANGSAPFKGGTLVPVPPLMTLSLFTNGAGGIPLAWAAWPGGLSGLNLYFQYAIPDAGAPVGVALSNALKAHVP